MQGVETGILYYPTKSWLINMKFDARLGIIILIFILVYLFNLAGHRTDTQRPPSIFKSK